jgi:DNA-binding winged helix-turn-helix (wHTH) protein
MKFETKPPHGSVAYEFGPFCVDLAERALTRGQQAIPLTPKAFDTLVVLLRNSGHVVEKDVLLKAVWPDTIVEEGVLAVNIAAIRKALSDGEEGRSYIETVPRRGYRFVGNVHTLGRTPKGELHKSQQPKKSWIHLGVPAVALIAFVVAGFGWYLLSWSRPSPLTLPLPLVLFRSPAIRVLS